MQRILKANFCFHLSLIAIHPTSHHAATPVPVTLSAIPTNASSTELPVVMLRFWNSG